MNFDIIKINIQNKTLLLVRVLTFLFEILFDNIFSSKYGFSLVARSNLISSYCMCSSTFTVRSFLWFPRSFVILSMRKLRRFVYFYCVNITRTFLEGHAVYTWFKFSVLHSRFIPNRSNYF